MYMVFFINVLIAVVSLVIWIQVVSLLQDAIWELGIRINSAVWDLGQYVVVIVMAIGVVFIAYSFPYIK